MSDLAYLKALAKGLNIKDIKSLSVVMGPDELKKKLSGLTLKDFDDGKSLITLHMHTTASDGSIAPQDYLDNALQFKNKYGCSLAIGPLQYAPLLLPSRGGTSIQLFSKKSSAIFFKSGENFS